ncbi:MAG: hypothetical protein ACREXS_17090 [Gammaproteobacteria bacterium]
MTATLIDIINAIIDADVQGDWQVLRPEDIARRAIERCGEGVFEAEAVTDLVSQIFSARCETTVCRGSPRSPPSWKSWRPDAWPGIRSR